MAFSSISTSRSTRSPSEPPHSGPPIEYCKLDGAGTRVFRPRSAGGLGRVDDRTPVELPLASVRATRRTLLVELVLVRLDVRDGRRSPSRPRLGHHAVALWLSRPALIRAIEPSSPSRPMVKGSPPASGVVETPVDRYRLLERVGEGTFSVVHKACPSTAPGTQVAVKRLKKVEQAGARIRDEVGCLMALVDASTSSRSSTVYATATMSIL